MRKPSRARVLVVEDVEAEAKLLMKALTDAGYSNLAHRQDVATAISEAQANPPRIVITDLKLKGSNGLELVKHLRTIEQGSYVYILMLTSAAADTVLQACFDAGVDDFVKKPFRTEEIVLRLRAGERILELETSLRAKSRELEIALRRIDIAAAQRALAKAAEVVEAKPAAGATPMDALLGTESWQNMQALLTKAMTDFFQLPFQPVDALAKPKPDAYIAEISLSEPAKQLELGLSVVVETPSMLKLGMHLLGDEDLEGAQALVLEVGNILMGTLKTTFTAHGFTFVGGIPASTSFAQAKLTFEGADVRSRMSIAVSDSEVELWLRVKEKSNTTVRGRNLKEGLVVGEDIRDAKGMLLIKGGSRLTQTVVERLIKLVPDLEISVSDPTA